MKISLSFTHPQAILGVYDFLFLINTIGDILINILTHPSFIMAVNGTQVYELKKVSPSTSIINIYSTRLRGVNKGLLKQSNSFV